MEVDYVGIDLHSDKFTCCFSSQKRNTTTFHLQEEHLKLFQNVCELYTYKGVKEVIRVFEVEIKQKIEEIDIRRKKGKRLRLKLLKELREEAGLKYKEINKISIFKKIKYYSLSHMYNIAISS